MTLISAEELLARLDDPRVRIADVRWYLGKPGRGRQEYEAGHIPGAMFVDLDSDLAGEDGGGRHPLPDARAFTRMLGDRGVGNDHAVIAYDDANGTVAARLWWMLDDLGHPDVRLLDGGLAAWRAAGGPLTTEVPSYPGSTLRLADRWRKAIDREALAGGSDDTVVLDLRAGERYRGETEPIDPVAGHIPGAVNAPSSGNLDPDGRFLPPHVLRDRYRALGGGERSIVVSCGSGVTACHAAVAMRLAGLPDPLLYPGSYSDWSRAGMPVATGPEPHGD